MQSDATTRQTGRHQHRNRSEINIYIKGSSGYFFLLELLRKTVSVEVSATARRSGQVGANVRCSSHNTFHGTIRIKSWNGCEPGSKVNRSLRKKHRKVVRNKNKFGAKHETASGNYNLTLRLLFKKSCKEIEKQRGYHGMRTRVVSQDTNLKP